MALSQMEKANILQGVISDYLFRTAFEFRNPGCYFDLDSWMRDLDAYTSKDLMIMTDEKWQELLQLVSDVDKYAKKLLEK